MKIDDPEDEEQAEEEEKEKEEAGSAEEKEEQAEMKIERDGGRARAILRPGSQSRRRTRGQRRRRTSRLGWSQSTPARTTLLLGRAGCYFCEQSYFDDPEGAVLLVDKKTGRSSAVRQMVRTDA